MGATAVRRRVPLHPRKGTRHARHVARNRFGAEGNGASASSGSNAKSHLETGGSRTGFGGFAPHVHDVAGDPPGTTCSLLNVARNLRTDFAFSKRRHCVAALRSKGLFSAMNLAASTKAPIENSFPCAAIIRSESFASSLKNRSLLSASFSDRVAIMISLLMGAARLSAGAGSI